MNPGLNIDGRSEKQKIEEATSLLLSRGYVVRPPIAVSSSVKTPSGLVKFFYDSMSSYSPQTYMIYAGDKKKDLAIAKRFIESRVSTGVSKARAAAECCELIKFLFKFESHLGLNFKVTSMSVLGNDKMSWLIEKLISAYNGLNKGIEESKERVWFENLYGKQELDISEEQIEAANKLLGLE